MAERLFLCGLSAAQRKLYGPGPDFQLHGPHANVRLRIDDLRRRLLEMEPELLTDWLEIATYVFAADCAVLRGGPALTNLGERWRRAFRLVIAVRQPGSWNNPERLYFLREALQFLTEDSWNFDFVDLTNAPRIQQYLPLSQGGNDKPTPTTVVPFSGGLDSFAGAVRELSQGQGHVVLLSRQLGGLSDQRQRELAEKLRSRYPGRITHVPVHVGLTEETKAGEHTQRSRSFLLTALSAAASFMEQSDRLVFYENGIMSINLPIATHVVGARASRSTHPRSLMHLQQLARSILGNSVTIENPFIWKTKVEVVRDLTDRPEADYIGHTLSCSRTRELSYYKPHCGRCAQCLQRRLSTLGAGASGTDPAEAYAVDLVIGPRQAGEDRVMAVEMIRSALEYRRMSHANFATRFAGELAWLSNGLSEVDVARRVVELFQRHGEAVRNVFKQAALDHADELIDRTLPDSCLLRITIAAPGIEFDEAPIKLPPQEDLLLRDEGAHDEVDASGNQILLAVDDNRKCILIDGLAPITSPTQYRIIYVLVELHRQDTEAQLAPRNFRCLSAVDVADKASSPDDTASRKVISRLRMKVSKEYHELYGGTPDQNAVVESVHGKGYRINPLVRIVAPSQLRRQ